MLYATGLTGVIGRYVGGRATALDYREFCKSGGIIEDRLEPASTVLHLAGVVGTALVNRDPLEAQRVNVDLLPAFIAGLARLGLERFAYVSSGHVYGNCANITEENRPVNPNSTYGQQKVDAENAVRESCEKHGIEFTVLRGFSIIHPDMPGFSLAGALSESILERSPLRFSDDVRDFMTPETMAKTMADLAISEASYVHEVVNVCTGVGFEIGEVARYFQTQFHPQAQPPVLAGGNSAFPRLVGSSERVGIILQDGAPQPPAWLGSER